MKLLINQETNYAGKFGEVYRSSAIFYKPKNIKTTISFCNYWQFKNGFKVALVITTRDLKGKLILREEVSFSETNVINYKILNVEEGSVEVEAFSSENLRIPYAAIMVVYEAQNSVSMVHSYGRNHSLIELEGNNAITEGRESCWTLRIDSNSSNKAIFHNGHLAIEAQESVFIVTREDGVEEKVKFTIPAVQKFETIIFEAEKIFPKLKDFLGEQVGWGTLHFSSESSFTRLLILWENSKYGEMQVTHSNFDYTAHHTNMIESLKPAYMVLPLVYGVTPNVIVYPKFSPGTYRINGHENFSSGAVIEGNKQTLTFERLDGQLPSRIVTAVTGKLNENTCIPFECSLGVFHEKRPPKRFHWFVISKKLSTVMHLTALKEIYPINKMVNVIIKLYSDTTKDIIEKSISFSSIEEMPNEIKVNEIFDLSRIDNFGYVSVFSHYGGLVVYSSLRKGNSLTLEHSF